ncbi:MAG TPA: ECF transporter S component, partial [Lachnospiraceae bacterium]|nr:ECF transporter S component [Lachnospiraceae bacterium]
MESAVRSSKHAHTSSKIRFITETAILIALTLIMGLTPLGTLRTPFLSVSLVTVPVALAAMLIGPAGALICATIFGATSF